MSAEVTVAIPHSHAYKWLQTSCYSLLAHDPGLACEFVIVDNYLAIPWSIDVIGTSDVADRFRVLKNDMPNRFHGSALDYALRRTETPFFFAMETDVQVLRDGWAPWYIDHMGDGAIGGFYWTEDETRMYVNPSATMYRTVPTTEFDDRCQADESDLLWYVEGGEWKSVIASERNLGFFLWGNGAFSDKRGYGEPMGLDQGRHQPGWYEPGQMLFYWLAEHCGWKAMPNVHEYLRPGLAGGTWYGDTKEDAYLRHYWGGTSAHNIDKHTTEGESINKWIPWWLEREHAVWCATVPDELRQHASEVMLSHKGEVPHEVIGRGVDLGVAWYYDYGWEPREPHGEPPQ
jgi:hypothetical protein